MAPPTSLPRQPVRTVSYTHLDVYKRQAQFGRVWIDLTVRRGDPFVGGLVQFDTNGSLSGVVAIEPTTSTASTALTGGLRASSTDLPEGNRAVWALQGGTSLTTTTGTGRIVQAATSTVSVPFMVGFELGGSASAGIEEAQDVLYLSLIHI